MSFMSFMENRKKLMYKKPWITTKNKVTKTVEWKNLQRDNYHTHTHTAQTHSEPVKHLRWSLLQTWLNISAKSSILGSDYLVDNFSQSWNFKSLNHDDEISSCMLSDSNNRFTIIVKTFITLDRAEISARFEQTELKFHYMELSWK